MKPLERKVRIRQSEILDQLLVGESYTNTKRLPLANNTETAINHTLMHQLRKKTEYLRTSCIMRMRKTGDVFDVTTFVGFNVNHTEIIFGTIATKTKIGESNPYFSNEEREIENNKDSFKHS